MHQWVVTAAAVCGLMCAAVGIARADTAAVLPFFNPSPARNLDWIGESVAEVVREALGSRGVLTLGRDDLREACTRLGLRQQALLSNASAIKIGEEVDAEHVVYAAYSFTPAPP